MLITRLLSRDKGYKLRKIAQNPCVLVPLCVININTYIHAIYNTRIYSDSIPNNLHFDISQLIFYLITSGSDVNKVCTKLSLESEPEGIQRFQNPCNFRYIHSRNNIRIPLCSEKVPEHEIISIIDMKLIKDPFKVAGS